MDWKEEASGIIGEDLTRRNLTSQDGEREGVGKKRERWETIVIPLLKGQEVSPFIHLPPRKM